MCSLILLCSEEKEKKSRAYILDLLIQKKKVDLFSVSFMSEMRMTAVSSILADTCSYCVIVFPAALQWVPLGFLEKISSAVACAGSYIFFFFLKWKLKSYIR